MWPNTKFPADLVTFTEEILNGKLHFCAVKSAGITAALILSTLEWWRGWVDHKTTYRFWTRSPRIGNSVLQQLGHCSLYQCLTTKIEKLLKLKTTPIEGLSADCVLEFFNDGKNDVLIVNITHFASVDLAQTTFTCSKSKLETPAQCVKFIQS